MRILVFVAILSASVPSWALSPGPEPLDARAVGMGGAIRSLAETVSAARYNPAALSLRRGFFGGVAYATQAKGAFDALQVTLVDNVTSPIGGAFQYVRLQGEAEREDVSLSMSAGGKGLWWGFTARYVHARPQGTAEWEELFTGDLGFLVTRPSGVRIAAIGYDVLDTTSQFLDRRIALAVSKTWDRGWAVGLDLLRDLDRDFSRGIDVHLGAEYGLPGSTWVFRGGQFWEGKTGRDYASAGVGWSYGSNLSLSYAVRKARQSNSEYLHVFGVSANF